MKILNLPLLVLMGFACSNQEQKKSEDPFGHIPDEKVKGVLERAIDYAGGWDAWNTMNSIEYKKRSKLILGDGTIESDVFQAHRYEMSSEFQATISWKLDTSLYEIQYDKANAMRFVNGVNDNSDPAKLGESVMSSLFVLGMPFKLLDPDVRLTYQGTEMFMDSVEADIINANYDPENVETHSTSDIWWFYFETETGHFLGSKVFHTPTYALIHNLQFTEEVPLKFPTRRKSYRTDSLGNIQFLRAEFWYSDFEVD